MRTQQERDAQTVTIATWLALFVVTLGALALVSWLSSLGAGVAVPAVLLAVVALGVLVGRGGAWSEVTRRRRQP